MKETCILCQGKGRLNIIDHDKRVLKTHVCVVCLGQGKLVIVLDNAG